MPEPAVVPPVPVPPPPPPPKPQTPGSAAAYEYDAQDAEEIRDQAMRLAGIEPKGSAQDYDRIIDHIIQEHRLAFDDAILEKRFRTMVTARLKDIRGSIETKERLQRAVKIGGLGFDDATASAVMGAVEKYASRVRQGEVIRPPTPPVPAPTPAASSPHEQMLSRIREQIAKPSVPPPPPAPSVPSPAPVSPLPPPPTPTVQVREPVFKSLPATPAPAISATPTVPVPPIVRPPLRRPMEFSDKPRMADIRAPYRVLGPVDELRTMTLDEFRRLGTTVADATKKLLEKINLLEEESFTKRAEGIAAWKRSPVNQLYLDIGRASMETAKPVEDVIRERQQAGIPTLTIDEFTGVVDLNLLLRF
ncbi:MAG: hypothetical protein HY341_02110 [Candidatus Kerfeldbacteria bacterium]|nr:hypothetical protein [Candidatus Kerfeldbacteria bacterium]